MRMIDADELLREVESSMKDNPHKEAKVRANHNMEHRHFMKLISSQPTVFDKGRVIEQIITSSQKMSTAKLPHTYYSAVSKEKAVGIVEAGGV